MSAHSLRTVNFCVMGPGLVSPMSVPVPGEIFCGKLSQISLPIFSVISVDVIDSSSSCDDDTSCTGPGLSPLFPCNFSVTGVPVASHK